MSGVRPTPCPWQTSAIPLGTSLLSDSPSGATLPHQVIASAVARLLLPHHSTLGLVSQMIP
jgi:hypothetical protein